MDRKPKPRRLALAVAAQFRKAGAHRKSNGALRRAGKVDTGRLAHQVEQRTFNPQVASSRLAAPTKNIRELTQALRLL